MLRGERRPNSRRPASGGFTYIGLLIAVAIMGIALSAAGTMWSVAAQREREVELLFVGHQFRDAVARYYNSGHRYPLELADLIDDDTSLVPRHFLRKIYADPMTGTPDWKVIRSADGGVMGIASTSQAKSIKRANFDAVDEGFGDVESYCDWQFIFVPRFGRERTYP